MIFTLFYMYSTIIQWWRLGSLRNKLSGTLNSHNAILVCSGKTISDNKSQRCLENLLFYHEDRIGCTVVPKQQINLAQWVMFPNNFNYFPIYISNSKITLKSPKVFLLLQAQLTNYEKHESEILQIEKFGELVAWKAKENFEMIIKTDMHNLTKLVHSFFDHNIDLNHELKLLRLETIDVEGHPSKIKFNLRYSVEQRLKYSLAPVHWNKFRDELKLLYSQLEEIPPKTLDNPTIKIEISTKPEEIKEIPVPEIKATKKSTEPVKHHKFHKRESKNKLEVTSENRRSKSNEKKSDRTKEGDKRREHKSKTSDSARHKGAGDSHQNNERTKAPKLAEIKDDSYNSKHRERKETKISKSKESETKLKETEIKLSNGDISIPKQASSNGNDSKVVTSENVPMKPPNVLVYADSIVAKDNVKNVLHSILNNHKYTVYDFPTNASSSQLWNDTTALLVVCGNVPPNLTSQLLQYLVSGGRLFCLCSDFLYSVLNIFSTAEVRDNELVKFSYDNWKRVKMMHHVFCYQASPAKRQFSKDSDQSNHSSRGSSPVAPRTPSVVEIQHGSKKYTIQVQVLGAEETWHTPSLLLASVKNTKGLAIFSQVHLEIDPTQYQDDESKYKALTESNHARLEILKHILCQHLGMDCTTVLDIEYGPGYFLGMHNLKQEMLTQSSDINENFLKDDKLSLKFFGKNVEPEPATAVFLPVLIYACPSNFSTVEYFETLNTNTFGRLVIYADVLTSSQLMLSKKLKNGLAVIVRQQTQGIGRSGNVWLSPLGCAMFSMQLHIPLDSNMGKSLPLIQHLVMTAIVSAIKTTPGYETLNLGLKWPNDLYANGNVKIGGLVVNSTILSNSAIVNIGCGVNLDNLEPTVCINDLIKDLSNSTNKPLPAILYEQYFAIIFNEMERIYNVVQEGDLEYFYELYYKYWLHSDANVTVSTKDGRSCQAKVVGIDEYGYLKVCSEDGTTSSVQPDGNSFDMLKGLIAPKIL